ncbi:MAG: hypothetical protein JW982_09685 [Spirochaetes bacterium]|nr:hypothetical protein [Spirochaetota bacterium]
MLTFFVTICVNILICTIFYLFVSLKLEKSASEFYVKKFRKEMDDTIREFNQTADRNISLLENRINVFKILLQKSGQIDSVDFNINDEKKELNDGGKTAKINRSIFNSRNKDGNFKKNESAVKGIDFTVNEEINFSALKNPVKAEDEIKNLFHSADDRHSLIGELYEEGIPVDIISRCSGIPAGEIKLILNLHGHV